MSPIGNTTHCYNASKAGGSSFLKTVLITDLVVGLPLNISALLIFCFSMKMWKPHTSLLFNLVLADFLLLVSVPFRLDAEFQKDNWPFGLGWCRVNLYMLVVNRSSSIAFMVAVALNRYFKVLHPNHCISRISLTQMKWVVGVIWVIVLLLGIPVLTVKLLTKDNTTWCRSFHSYSEIPAGIKAHYIIFTAEFLLPWIVLLFCTSKVAFFLHKQKIGKQRRLRRAIQSVVVISLVFTICFMPSVVTGWGAIYIKHSNPNNCWLYGWFTYIFEICIGLTYLNSAMDPLIYIFASSIFRDAVRGFFSYLGCVRKKKVRTDKSYAQ